VIAMSMLEATTLHTTEPVASEADRDRAAMPEPGCPGFDAWVQAETDRMRQAALDAAALAVATAPAITHEAVMTGRFSGEYVEALSALALTQGMTTAKVTGLVRAAMMSALYLADCKVADLRAAREPAEITALAAPVVDRLGFQHLINLHYREAGDIRQGNPSTVFPKEGRYGAAVDAAYRWDWRQMPEEWIADQRRAVGGKARR